MSSSPGRPLPQRRRSGRKSVNRQSDEEEDKSAVDDTQKEEEQLEQEQDPMKTLRELNDEHTKDVLSSNLTEVIQGLVGDFRSHALQTEVKAEPNKGKAKHNPKLWPDQPERKCFAPRFLNERDMIDQVKTKIIHTAYFMLFGVVLTIMWCYTTGTYKAALPYQRIQDLTELPLVTVVPVHLIFADTVSSSDCDKTIERLRNEMSKFELERLRVELDFVVESADQQLRTRLANWELIRENSGGQAPLAEIAIILDDESPKSDENAIQFDIEFVIAGQAPKKDEPKVYWTSTNRVFVLGAVPADWTESVKSALNDVYLTTAHLALITYRYTTMATTTEEYRQRPKIEERVNFSSALDQHRIWGTVPAPEMAIDTYLVLPTDYLPAECATSVNELMDGVRRVVSAITSQVSSLTTIRHTTHRLYDVNIPDNVIYYDQSNDLNTVTAGQLPLLVNPLEKHMITIEQTAPVYRILLYQAPTIDQPIRITDPRGEYNSFNAFSVADWGGLTILNTGECPQMTPDVLSTVANLVRQVLGVNKPILPDDHVVLPLADGTKFIRNWELRSMQLVQVLHDVLKATSTLSQLDRLLWDIENIQISDHIADEIHKAVDHLEEAHQLLKETTSTTTTISSALSHAQQAVSHSETAYFDESLVSLLYFPSDQKYAIYVPLFLPVGMPVIFWTFLMIFQIVKHRRSTCTVTEEQRVRALIRKYE